MINKKIILSSVVAGLLSFSMTGCGKNNKTTPDTIIDDPLVTVLTQVSGVAVDGYIRNGLVCLDINNNNECDDGEPFSKTSTDGSYLLDLVTLTETQKDTAKILVSGGIDDATGRSFTGILKAPLGDEAIVNITPITTIVAAKVKNKADIAGAMIDVAASLNVSVADLKLDPIKAQNKELFEAGLKIQKSLEILQEAVRKSGSAAEAADNFSKLAEKLAEGFNGTSLNVDTVVDTTDFSQIAGLENANIVKDIIRKINESIIVVGTESEEDLEKLSYLVENLKEEVKQSIEYSKAENKFSEIDYDDTVLLVNLEGVFTNFDVEREKIKKMIDVIDLEIEDAAEDALVTTLLTYQKSFAFNSTPLQYKTIISSITFATIDLPIKYLLLNAIEKKILEHRGIDDEDTLDELVSGFRLFSVKAEKNTNDSSLTDVFDNFSASIEDIELEDSNISFNKTSMNYGIDGYVFHNSNDTTWFDGQTVTDIPSRIYGDVAKTGTLDGIYRYEDDMGTYHYQITGEIVTNRHEIRKRLRLENGVWITEAEDSGSTTQGITYNTDGTITVKDSNGKVTTEARLVVSEDLSGGIVHLPVKNSAEFIDVNLSAESKRYVIELKEAGRETIELHKKVEDHTGGTPTDIVNASTFTYLTDFFNKFHVATVGNEYNSLFHDNKETLVSTVVNSYQFKGDLNNGFGVVVKSVSTQDPITFAFTKTGEVVVGAWEVKQLNGVNTIYLSGYNVDRIFSQENGNGQVFAKQAFIYTVVNNEVYQGVYVLTQGVDRVEVLFNEKAAQDIAAAVDTFAEVKFNKLFEDITLP